MKKAAEILLKISSILDLVLAIVLYAVGVIMAFLTIGASLFLCIPATLLLLASIFARKARSLDNQNPLITTAVFAFLCGELVALTGSVLGLVHFYTNKGKEPAAEEEQPAQEEKAEEAPQE